VQPGTQRSITAEIRELLERTYERLLREILRTIAVAVREPVAQPEHAVDMRVVQCSLGSCITRDHGSDQVSIGHACDSASKSCAVLLLVM